jgi:hypothetical protein
LHVFLSGLALPSLAFARSFEAIGVERDLTKKLTISCRKTLQIIKNSTVARRSGSDY